MASKFKMETKKLHDDLLKYGDILVVLEKENVLGGRNVVKTVRVINLSGTQYIDCMINGEVSMVLKEVSKNNLKSFLNDKDYTIKYINVDMVFSY